ncbi:MAG: hypothetical protein H6830_07675 [Planctomycetes bacterium]|nr:hypothetical protein [Planctomycetota bacterium]HRV82734.1 hypothetical protein [Planctomycetota bacterium]
MRFQPFTPWLPWFCALVVGCARPASTDLELGGDARPSPTPNLEIQVEAQPAALVAPEGEPVRVDRSFAAKTKEPIVLGPSEPETWPDLACNDLARLAQRVQGPLYLEGYLAKQDATEEELLRFHLGRSMRDVHRLARDLNAALQGVGVTHNIWGDTPARAAYVGGMAVDKDTIPGLEVEMRFLYEELERAWQNSLAGIRATPKALWNSQYLGQDAAGIAYAQWYLDRALNKQRGEEGLQGVLM